MNKPQWERAMPFGLYDVVMDALAIGDAMAKAAATCGPDNAFAAAQRELTQYMRNQWPDINWPHDSTGKNRCQK